MHKLSTLSDVEIEKCLNSMDFDFDTDGEEESEDDLADEVCETAFPVNDEDQEAIERAVNMSDSMLASEICVTSSGSSAPLAKLLSPSTSIASNSPQAQKRKRKAPAEHDIAHAEESTITEFVGSVLDIDPKSPIFKKILWRQNNLVLDKSAISFTEIDLGDLKKLDTPFKCFEYFLNDTIIEHITQQTNLYAAQKDVNTSFSTTDLEIRQFIGILFFMSVFRYPNVRSYWGEYAFGTVQITMSKNRFEQIRSNLHFNDNSKLPSKDSADHDPLYKIRPIVNHFNEKFQSVPMTQRLSVDEQMCATKMKTFLRQYLPDKPHKWGVKFFNLCDSFGFCYNFEIYCGAGDNVVQTGSPDLGASANVVVRLSRNVPDFKNQIIYFDNYYTSFPLLVYLKSRGIFSLGTIRSNRIPNCKLPTDSDLKKQVRGYSTEFCGSASGVEMSLTVWKDNKAVRLASTYAGTKPFLNETNSKGQVSRFVRSEKKYVDIDCPNVIHEYNSNMGGVDLMDGLIGRYKIPVKSNKYTNRLFTHMLDLAMVNAYIFFHRINKPDANNAKYQLPNFRSEVAYVLCMLQTPSLSKGPGRPRQVAEKEKKYTGKKTFLPPNDVRYDGVEHFPMFLSRAGKKTCKLPGCTSETQIVCRKCNINLCLSQQKDCFYDFHHK